MRMPWIQWALGLVAVALAASCGGGRGDPSNGDGGPLRVVRIFPSAGDLQLPSLTHAPTFVDASLATAAGPTGGGAVAIHFQPPGKLDLSSLYVGGEPVLGVDPSALQFLRYLPGTGFALLDIATVDLVNTPGEDVVRLVPEDLPLPAGQYHVAVFEDVQDLLGNSLHASPALQTFWVGGADVDDPSVVYVSPSPGATGVPSGAASEVVTIRVVEPVAASTLSTDTVYVEDISGLLPLLVTPAAGYPRLQSVEDGTVYPSNGHAIVWRAHGGLPPSATLRIRVVGALPAGGVGTPGLVRIEDLNGHPIPETWTSTFETAP